MTLNKIIGQGHIVTMALNLPTHFKSYPVDDVTKPIAVL